MDFADIKNDIAFRKIFGNEQKTAPLISFLNAALQLEGDERVVSVSLANPYQFPRIAGEKATVLDVRATDHLNRKFVVEMQVADKEELVTPIDKWTFFIKNATGLHVIPAFANEDEGLKTAFIEADKYQWTKEEIIAYDNVTIKEADEVQEKLKVAEKAKEEGKEEGKEEMIISMHEEGLSNQQIAKISKKSEAEVALIIENHKNR
jgi:PD-(D/E)XK nuclease family transposase